MTERLAEKLGVVGYMPNRVITTAAQTIYTGVVDMSKYHQAIVIAGAKSGGTRNVLGLTVKLWDCDASGTAAGTAFKIGTSLLVTSTAATSPIAVYDVRAADLGQTYGAALNVRGRYFKASVTTSTNVRDIYSLYILAEPRYGPADDYDLSVVGEVGIV
jgi:large exoprotein involved in heme utilization and adhesion